MEGINIIGQQYIDPTEYAEDAREQDNFDIPTFDPQPDPSDHIVALEATVRNMDLEEQQAVARGLDPIVMLEELITTVRSQHEKLKRIEDALGVIGKQFIGGDGHE